MFNIIVLWISPLLLENVALRMGNLQVIKIRCKRVRIFLGWVLGALYVTGWGNLLNAFLFLACHLWFQKTIFRWTFWDVLMRPACHDFLWFHCNVWDVLMKNKLLFIHLRELCDMWYSVMWLNLICLKKIFNSGKRGVTVPSMETQSAATNNTCSIDQEVMVGNKEIHEEQQTIHSPQIVALSSTSFTMPL